MSKVTLYAPFNAAAFPFATTAVSYPILTSTHIQEVSDSTEANFYGMGFDFSGEDIVDGTLTGADFSTGGELQFEVTGLNHDAATVYDFIVAEDAPGLLAFVLSGADVVTGSSGSDVFFGYGGTDEMVMRGGNDSAFGGVGADLLSGGPGHDLCVGESGWDTLRGGDGNDGLFGEGGNDTLLGGEGNDFADGGTGVDSLVGGDGEDWLDGSGGSDTLNGGRNGDILEGGGGKDRLEGRGGGDILNGENGNDILVGGGGSDLFWFNSAPGAKNIDSILDFEGAGASGQDTIVLENGVFLQLTEGFLATTQFVSGPGVIALDADDYILYDTGNGALYYDADGSGPTAAIRFATVKGSPDGLDSTDFEVV